MAVNSFSVMSLGKVNLMDPQKVGYRDAIDILQDEFHRTRKAFVKIGFYLKHIKDNQLYQEDGYKTIDEFAADIFGLSQSSTSRYINICEKFSVDGNSPELAEQFVEYNVSQLMEMVSIEPEKIEQLSPKMSVQEIKEFKRPDEIAISNFYKDFIAKTEYAARREGLKDYLIENFGQTGMKGAHPGLTYTCSRKGIILNESSEITWSTLVKEINRLIPMKADESKKDEQLSGQTSLEKDFPQYMPEDSYATSHKSVERKTTCPDLDQGEQIIDGEFREITVEVSEEIQDKSNLEIVSEQSAPCLAAPCLENEDNQSKLPLLKNVGQRKEWLNDYKAWGLWYRDDNIDVNYYKFDFPDGSRLICCEYPDRDHEWWESKRDEVYYHLLEKNKSKYGSKNTFDEKFSNHTTSETYLVEFLKRFK